MWNYFYMLLTVIHIIIFSLQYDELKSYNTITTFQMTGLLHIYCRRNNICPVLFLLLIWSTVWNGKYWLFSDPLLWMLNSTVFHRNQNWFASCASIGELTRAFGTGPSEIRRCTMHPPYPSPREFSYYYTTPVPFPTLFTLFLYWYSVDALQSFHGSTRLLR